jgi:hypothetical protein
MIRTVLPRVKEISNLTVPNLVARLGEGEKAEKSGVVLAENNIKLRGRDRCLTWAGELNTPRAPANLEENWFGFQLGKKSHEHFWQRLGHRGCLAAARPGSCHRSFEKGFRQKAENGRGFGGKSSVTIN